MRRCRACRRKEDPGIHPELHARWQGLRSRQYRCQRRRHSQTRRGQRIRCRCFRRSYGLHHCEPEQYRALVFSNSNNQAFETDSQRDAFKAFIRAGGGFVGIHSASGSERDWDYYQQVVGGKFKRHPKLQPFTVQVVAPKFPAVRRTPAKFDWEDECYYVEKLNPGVKPVLVTDPRKIVDPQFATDPGGLVDGMRPLAWYQTFDGGREFYLALGHKKEDYENPLLTNIISGGIQWAMGKSK
jgi:uncharacterized protein